MPISVCPAALVAAPIEDVWKLLAQPAHYGDWADAHVERVVPEGPVVEGQQIDLWSTAFGRRVDIHFTIEKVHPAKHQVQIIATFPFGMVEHTTITCTPVDSVTTRVQYG